MGGSAATEGIAPRRAALALLNGVLNARRQLSELIEAPEGPLARLPPADRARAQRLAASALRHVGPADAVLAPLLRKSPPAGVRNLMRLAVAERFVECAPAHAVVNASVALARQGRRTAHLSGLVNAVLRRALAEPAERWAALPPQRLPDWLRAPLLSAWGEAAVAAMEVAHARGGAHDLTPRDPASAEDLAARLGAELLPTGSLRLARGSGAVSALPGYADGEWWVQDAAAALPARVLGARPGERVLDACAAPGGKTLQLAAAGAAVTALDISAPRVARLRDNLARTGLAAECVVADALHWSPDAPFDAILLDAPCTATGTIRRHPDLPFVRVGGELPELTALQAALLDRALGWLRPGGRLVYATCSLLPDEGEAQMRAVLDRHGGLTMDAEACNLPGVPDAWRSAGGGLRTRPDFWAERGGLDGFYMACLRRQDQSGFCR
jgi:16S rRNA (cytosine967-C5)-methyltransferase